MNFAIASKDEFYEIKHFLKRHNTYSANRTDIIYTIRSGNKLIGLARLITVDDDNNTLWLRGLFIDEAWRHKGLATSLLNYLHKNQIDSLQTTNIVAFAEPHLKKFYQQNSYTEVTMEQLPSSLKKRLENAYSQGKKWLCLMRS
ncbi:MAG: GNAT family N-acetyltransferase [Pseudomonadota bacterium]|nr:GNAT family N-acetyltransferase [Pseudomonadota bacterium]